jgi:O-antigen biosynthesis protein WbqV
MLLDSVLRLGPASMHPALPRLLIIGSANEAEAFLRAPAGLGERYAPIGVVSPLDRETGDELRGVCVLGAIADFDSVLARLRDSGLPPSAILFLTDSAMSTFGAERLGRLKTEGVRLLRRHGVVEMGAAAAAAAVLREISLEELLSRPPVRLDPEPVRALVSGRRVLVTGAGGSIGSELCRQIAASGCAHLTMVDSSEYNLFHIDREIAETTPACRAAKCCATSATPPASPACSPRSARHRLPRRRAQARDPGREPPLRRRAHQRAGHPQRRPSPPRPAARRTSP